MSTVLRFSSSALTEECRRRVGFRVLLVLLVVGLNTAPALAPLPNAFNRVDGNKDGRLATEEIGRFEELKARLAGADMDGDGFVKLAEFRGQMLKAGAPGAGVASSGKGNLTPGEQTRSVKVGEAARRYRVHIPPSYDATRATN